MLRYQSVSRNKVAISEFAALVVEYERLEKEEQGRGPNEAKRRELGLKKVALYDKYNLSLFMLKVPKSKMPQYRSFWPDFWRRVDEFKKNNPGIDGPGPFTLPREGRLANLSKGAMSLAKGIGDALATKEAFAVVVDDYPKCSFEEKRNPRPILHCDPKTDGQSFWFEVIYRSNDEGPKYAQEGSPVIQQFWEYYKSDVRCQWKGDKFISVGGVHVAARVEKDICGGSARDNSGSVARKTVALFDNDGRFVPAPSKDRRALSGFDYTRRGGVEQWDLDHPSVEVPSSGAPPALYNYLSKGRDSRVVNYLRCFPKDDPYNDKTTEQNKGYFGEHPLTDYPDLVCD